MALPSITLRNTKGSALTFTEMDNNLTNLQTANIQVTVGATTSNISLNSAIEFTSSTLNGSLTANVVAYDINPQATIVDSNDGIVGVTYVNTDSTGTAAVSGLMTADDNSNPMLLWKTNSAYNSATDDLVGGDAVLLNVGGDLQLGSVGGDVVVFAGGTTSADTVATFSSDKTVTFTGDIVGNTSGYAIGYKEMPQVAAGNVTLALADSGKHFYSTSAAPLTITVPTNASVAFPTGTVITVVNQGTANLTVDKGSATVYLGGNTTSASRTITSYGVATLLKVASDTWFINGTGVV